MILFDRQLNEALTIPVKGAGPIEMDLRDILTKENSSYKDFKYKDALIKFCRNDERAANGDSERLADVKKTYGQNLTNIVHLFQNYDGLKDEYVKQRISTAVQITQSNGKTVQLHPLKDFGRIGRLEGFEQFIDAFDKLVRGDTSIGATFEKYSINDEDRKNIILLGAEDGVAVWVTKYFSPSQKFAVQLWQNIKTIDNAGEYGHPERQCPYCTHAESHWDRHAEGDAEYQQYWYLKVPEGSFDFMPGDLTNASVVKLYNAMRGLGPEILVCQHDSHDDWCDYEDVPLKDSDGYGSQIHDSDVARNFNFRGKLDAVRKLYDKCFSSLDDKNWKSDPYPWETGCDYDRRMNIRSVYPKALNNDNGQAVWRHPITLTPGMFKDGKLTFKLPDIVQELTVSAQAGNKWRINSFENFPKIIQQKLEFQNCTINATEWPQLDISRINNVELENTVGYEWILQTFKNIKTLKITTNSANNSKLITMPSGVDIDEVELFPTHGGIDMNSLSNIKKLSILVNAAADLVGVADNIDQLVAYASDPDSTITFLEHVRNINSSIQFQLDAYSPYYACGINNTTMQYLHKVVKPGCNIGIKYSSLPIDFLENVPCGLNITVNLNALDMLKRSIIGLQLDKYNQCTTGVYKSDTDLHNLEKNNIAFEYGQNSFIAYVDDNEIRIIENMQAVVFEPNHTVRVTSFSSQEAITSFLNAKNLQVEHLTVTFSQKIKEISDVSLSASLSITGADCHIINCRFKKLNIIFYDSYDANDIYFLNSNVENVTVTRFGGINRINMENSRFEKLDWSDTSKIGVIMTRSTIKLPDKKTYHMYRAVMNESQIIGNNDNSLVIGGNAWGRFHLTKADISGFTNIRISCIPSSISINNSKISASDWIEIMYMSDTDVVVHGLVLHADKLSVDMRPDFYQSSSPAISLQDVISTWIQLGSNVNTLIHFICNHEPRFPSDIPVKALWLKGGQSHSFCDYSDFLEMCTGIPEALNIYIDYSDFNNIMHNSTGLYPIFKKYFDMHDGSGNYHIFTVKKQYIDSNGRFDPNLEQALNEWMRVMRKMRY